MIRLRAGVIFAHAHEVFWLCWILGVNAEMSNWGVEFVACRGVCPCGIRVHVCTRNVLHAVQSVGSVCDHCFKCVCVQKYIADFRERCSKIPCARFDKGKGKCPFGNFALLLP